MVPYPPVLSSVALVETEKVNNDLGPIGLLGVQPLRKEPSATYSYQQINCLDSIVRYVAALASM